MKTPGKWIEEIDADAPVWEGARRVFRARLAAVTDWLPRAHRRADENPEFVHQLRVATRRAAAALEVFRPWLPTSAHAKLRKRLRRIRRAAGEARDCDVFAMAVEAQREKAPKTQIPALDYLRKLCAKRRAKAQEEIDAAAARYPPAKLRRGQRRFLKALAEAAKQAGQPASILALRNANGQKRSPDGSLPRAPSLRDAAQQTLPPLLADLRAAAQRDLRQVPNLHQLRLCAKPLRYAAEIFAPCFDSDVLQQVYPQLEELQERLGRINDADQFVQRLDEARARLDRRRQRPDTASLRRGLQTLRRRYTAQLNRLRRDFLQWWQRTAPHDCFGALASARRRPQTQRTAPPLI